MDYKDCICGDCQYLRMWYDKQGWEIFSCGNEDGRGTEDPENVACRYFENKES